MSSFIDLFFVVFDFVGCGIILGFLFLIIANESSKFIDSEEHNEASSELCDKKQGEKVKK